MTKELLIDTKVDDVMGYMNFKFHDYELHKPVHLFSSETYKDYLSTLWHDLNDGEDLKSMQDLYETPKYKTLERRSRGNKGTKKKRVCMLPCRNWTIHLRGKATKIV